MSTYMISLGTGLASTPATSSNCSIALVFFWPTDGGNFIRWLLKYTPLALKSGNLIPPVSWNNEKKCYKLFFFIHLDRVFKYRISQKCIFPLILSHYLSKISKGPFKYYVSIFLAFLGPPTIRCQHKQYCKLAKIAIFWPHPLISLMM